MLGLALANLLVSGTPAPADDVIDRGIGWYSASAPTIPEPPVALALVIVAAAGMRVRERRLQRSAG